MKRIEEHQEEQFSNIQDARDYLKFAKKKSKLYNGIIKHINSLKIKGKYLEVGAGPCVLTSMIAESNPEVKITAFDISLYMIEVAKDFINKKQLQDRIKIYFGDLTDKDKVRDLGKFDLVYSTYSMHHWKNPGEIIMNLLSTVADDGILLIHDLRKVWWLYYFPVYKGWFFSSIRAAFTPKEIKNIFNNLDIHNISIKRTYLVFQSIIVKK